MAEQQKKKNQKGPFEQAWYSNCPKHKDVYKMFFRPCTECLKEEELEDALLALAVVVPECEPKNIEKGLNNLGFKIVRIK